ncbi:MAG: hypothetical protein AVDCRST_MAG28-2163 [uncultured Rubrobacteraceae bacterium]|uniref:Uncharacterized protein n=1 Tax=uncultured Rubrobacteraceae bacterium TaxID=349277 RepID=A0A6J4R195_9ACTN|nr:MAG: hypothetical protein AVDCRST_MAG28-2163 [uncultured Rubrobacteraceae bacterium]
MPGFSLAYNSRDLLRFSYGAAFIMCGNFEATGEVEFMSRRDYDEGYEEARREMQEREFGSSRGDSGGAFTAAVFIKYLAIVVVVIIVAYVVLQILQTVQFAF